MAFHIVNCLLRTHKVGGSFESDVTSQNIGQIICLIATVYTSFVQDTSFNGITEVVTKEAIRTKLTGIVLMGQKFRIQSSIHLPPFSIKVNVGVNGCQFFLNFHHGLAVKNAHQVKAETIKAVELNPLLD